MESLARIASLGLSGIKLRFFVRLSLYRSGFFIRPRVSSAFIHVIKRVISQRDERDRKIGARARADVLLFPG